MPAALGLADGATELVLLAVALIWCIGRGRLSRLSVPRAFYRDAAFVIGVLCGAGVVSPSFDSLGVESFSYHMLQHLLLIIVAAPLVAWSRPGPVLRAAIPVPPRTLGGIEYAWCAAALFAVTTLLWHVPRVHDVALADPSLHWSEHLSVFGTAIAFWRFAVFTDYRVSQGTSVFIVWLISLQGALLSAVIMFAPSQLCRSYVGNPLSDQIQAGLLMCIPASLAYAGSTVWGLARLFVEAPAAKPSSRHRMRGSRQ